MLVSKVNEPNDNSYLPSLPDGNTICSTVITFSGSGFTIIWHSLTISLMVTRINVSPADKAVILPVLSTDTILVSSAKYSAL